MNGRRNETRGERKEETYERQVRGKEERLKEIQ